jgi:transposase
VLFNLSGYRVVEAVDSPLGIRKVVVESLDREGGCPSCGVLTGRVHQRTFQRVRDVQVGGAVEVWWRKRRFACTETACGRRTFAEHTKQVPRRARCTVRLRDTMLEAVAWAGRAVLEVAGSFGVAWWTVQAVINTAAAAMANPDSRPVRHLGIDEHRYRQVRFFRDPDTAKWRRYEPWMTTMVDLDTGLVLGVVDGRGSAGVKAWLSARSPAWRASVQVVAIDPSAAFRKAITDALPHAAVSVDHFHLVQLANQMLTMVRQRVSRDLKGRRGRALDASWANRRLLLRGHDTLSEKGRARLIKMLHEDDPTQEIGAAWGVKEQLRTLLACGSLADAHEEKMRLGYYVMVADMAETWRLWETINAWWTEIEVFLITGVTNARTEAANTSIKQLKRTGRGYRNAEHYKARILLRSAARRAA